MGLARHPQVISGELTCSYCRTHWKARWDSGDPLPSRSRECRDGAARPPNRAPWDQTHLYLVIKLKFGKKMFERDVT
jgi:hypothetical protein